ncbi:hypothetical protein Tco_0776862 [Tanacetum coccineum]
MVDDGTSSSGKDFAWSQNEPPPTDRSALSTPGAREYMTVYLLIDVFVAVGIIASILPTDEIKDALQKVYESLNIPLGQAWVLNKKIKGLVGIALGSRQPHFCRNTYKFKELGILPLLSCSTPCSCRVIPLSLVVYVFDILKSKSFNILPGNKLLEISEASKKQVPYDDGGESKKRKFSELPKKETDSETDTKSDVQSDYDLNWEEEDDAIILAAYKQNANQFSPGPHLNLHMLERKLRRSWNWLRGLTLSSMNLRG